MFESWGEAVYKLTLWFFICTLCWIPVVAALWLVWLFLSVIFLGESSSCEQNLC